MGVRQKSVCPHSHMLQHIHTHYRLHTTHTKFKNHIISQHTSLHIHSHTCRHQGTLCPGDRPEKWLDRSTGPELSVISTIVTTLVLINTAVLVLEHTTSSVQSTNRSVATPIITITTTNPTIESIEDHDFY